MSKTNSVSTEPATTLIVCILIDGKEILLDVSRDKDIMKGVLISGTHVEPRSVYSLNETTFLVTYSSGILAEEIGSAIEKIDEWLSKPVVITCDDATAIQLPQVIEHACHTTGVESVVFNTRVDDMRSDSNPSVHSGYHSYVGGPAVLGNQVPPFGTKCQVYHSFLVQRWKRTLSGLNSGFILSLMLGKNVMISG